MRKLLHERKFQNNGTAYKIYDDGLVEYFSGGELRESGTLVEQINGKFPKYNAHLTLGLHEASTLKFTIYGKPYRFYTRVKSGEMGKHNAMLDTIKGKARKVAYMRLAVAAIREAKR
jgi:hypothetical protein